MTTHSPCGSITPVVRKTRRRLARAAGRDLLIRRGFFVLLISAIIGAARPLYLPMGSEAPLWLGMALALGIAGASCVLGTFVLLIVGRKNKPSELGAARAIDEALDQREVVASGFAFERDDRDGALENMTLERATIALTPFDPRKALTLPSLRPRLRLIALAAGLAIVVALLGSYHPALASIMTAPPNERERLTAAHLEELAQKLDHTLRTTTADEARQATPDRDSEISKAERRSKELFERLSAHAREASDAARRGDRASALRKLDTLNRSGREATKESRELQEALRRIAAALRTRSPRGDNRSKSSADQERASQSTKGGAKGTKGTKGAKGAKGAKGGRGSHGRREAEELLRRLAEKLEGPAKSGREGTAERREVMEALARAVAQAERAQSSLKSGRQQQLTKQLAEALAKAGTSLGAGKRSEAAKQLEAAIQRARELNAMQNQAQRQAEALANMLKAAGMLSREMQMELAGKRRGSSSGAKLAQLGMPGKGGKQGLGGKTGSGKGSGSGSGSGSGGEEKLSSTDLARALALRLAALGMTGSSPTGNPGHGPEGSADNRGAPHKALPVNDSLRARSEVGASEGELAVNAIKGLGRSSEPTKEYRDVFPTYAALAEESMADEVVPAAQRHVVRQYFESIRPGGAQESADSATEGE